MESQKDTPDTTQDRKRKAKSELYSTIGVVTDIPDIRVASGTNNHAHCSHTVLIIKDASV